MPVSHARFPMPVSRVPVSPKFLMWERLRKLHVDVCIGGEAPRAALPTKFHLILQVRRVGVSSSPKGPRPARHPLRAGVVTDGMFTHLLFLSRTRPLRPSLHKFIDNTGVRLQLLPDGRIFVDMGWGFRRGVNFGPLRLNASKSGLGWSVGGRGFRVGRDARGRRYTAASVPGTGIFYRSYKKSAAQVSSPGSKSYLGGRAAVCLAVCVAAAALIYGVLLFLLRLR